MSPTRILDDVLAPQTTLSGLAVAWSSAPARAYTGRTTTPVCHAAPRRAIHPRRAIQEPAVSANVRTLLAAALTMGMAYVAVTVGLPWAL